MAPPAVSRRDVLRFRFRRQQLDAEPGTTRRAADVGLLDYGVQDTGSDGAAWALAVRGVASPAFDDLALAWTLRGAPHAYPRSCLGPVAVATAPLSEADAAKRIFDAAKPLKAVGISVLHALRVVADHMRDITREPTVKGEVSSRLTQLLGEPYLRDCRPCGTTHVYEMPFRLAALHGGLDLEPATSPPVLRRIPGMAPPRFERLADEAEPRFDVIRNHLRFYGPTRVADVAGYVDATAKDVKARWPRDAVEVTVTDDPGDGRPRPRFVLAEDLDELMAAGSGPPAGSLRILGTHDPYLQLRDRDLLVPDEGRRKDLWRVLGRPGAVVADGEVVGTWRPRTAGRQLTVAVEPWGKLRTRDRALLREEAERLAAHRGVTLAGVPES